jgi:iron(III) transport system substrate-binding protein
MTPSLKAARLFAAVAAAALSTSLAIDHAKAEGNLTVYCSVQEEWCQLMVNEF